MDAQRLTELYRQYAPLVHARARRMVGDEAPDVVQEVFLRLVQKPPKGDGLTSWMYTTTTTVCLDRLRYLGRRDEAWSTDLREVLESQSVATEQLVVSRELCRKLLAKMDERTQAVVALVYLDEMTHEEAAQSLGLSRKTVGERLARFAENVRKIVSRWETPTT